MLETLYSFITSGVGVTIPDFSLFLTVILQVKVLPFAFVAVMTALPSETAVIFVDFPFAVLTLTTEGLSLVHVYLDLALFIFSLYVFPTVRVSFFLFIFSAAASAVSGSASEITITAVKSSTNALQKP